MLHHFKSDIMAVTNISAVPTILDVICRTTGMGFAAVARVTEGRWIACQTLDNIQFGLKPGGELKVESTICHEIRQTQQPVIINHVSEDDIYRDHHTPRMYGFQSYISMPIILPDGNFFGTLCAIDPRPARLNTPEIIGMFKLFAELIAFHLDAHAQLASSAVTLREERSNSELREQFIAVLGHDLRNPLGAISSAAQLLERTTLNERGATLTALIKDSAHRMLGLIEDVLDFARGRLGGGISISKESHEPLGPVLQQVVAELRANWPRREIQTSFSLDKFVQCDRRRIGQLFSNLLGNALTHGTADMPVRVNAFCTPDNFELSVTNSARQITPVAMERLFQPFCRGDVKLNKEGLGLGLYIASEIARAHGGLITVSSTPVETCFTFKMPLANAAKISEKALKTEAA